MENQNNVRNKFDEIAPDYNRQRRSLIPCFDDFYSIPVSLARWEGEQPRILDIGAGTGLFSSFFLEKFPQAHITLIDLSEKMLDMARIRFENYPDFTYVAADYTRYPFTNKFDIIISSLSIHHLSEEEKDKLYKNIYSWLNPGGFFINADQVLGHSPYIEDLYKKDWREKVEKSDLSQEEITAAYERAKLDKMSTLEDQLNWLNQAGFSEVDCVYKYFNFVVLYGKKNTANQLKP